MLQLMKYFSKRQITLLRKSKLEIGYQTKTKKKFQRTRRLFLETEKKGQSLANCKTRIFTFLLN